MLDSYRAPQASANGVIMASFRDVSLEQIRQALPAELPAGIARIIRNYYERESLAFNTDWAGTMPMWALLKWAKRGVPGTLDCVKAWFEAHVQRDLKLTDDEFGKTYTGRGSRLLRGTHLPFTMYAGFFGLVFPLSDLFFQTGDLRAKTTCQEIGDAIMYLSRRNQYGLIAHDNHWIYDIPDAGFFAIQALMLVAKVDPTQSVTFVKHAVAQLRAYIDVFLDRKLGLSKTILGPDGLGKTYWCRAQGWLIWAIMAVLRDLPAGHPAFKGFRDDLEVFASGLAKATDADGLDPRRGQYTRNASGNDGNGHGLPGPARIGAPRFAQGRHLRSADSADVGIRQKERHR